MSHDKARRHDKSTYTLLYFSSSGRISYAEFEPDIVDTIFVKSEAVDAVRSIDQQLNVFTNTNNTQQRSYARH